MLRYLWPLALLTSGVMVCAAGCTSAEDSAPSSAAEESAREEAAEASEKKSPGEPYSERRRMMGTVFMIRAEADPRKARPAVAKAFGELERLELLLSEWRPGSEISKINEAAGRYPVRVSEETFAVVSAGVDMSERSEGAFDLSWAALHGLYDFRPNLERIPGLEEIRPRLALIDYRAIALDESAQTVYLKRRGMKLGTGAIGKGYALDRASEILRDAGISSFMIFGGGQVQAYGMRGDRPYRVGIQHPRSPAKHIGFFETSDGSISTSGDYERALTGSDGERVHHILDPRTGLPSRASMAVTVLSSSGLYADALSTAGFILGPEKALALFEAVPVEVSAVIVGPDCKVYTTPGGFEEAHLEGSVNADGYLEDCVP